MENISDRSLKFAIEISKYYTTLKSKNHFEIASQLFKSGTSIWANISEAQSWSSKKDFVNKLNIALKEAKETKYRLELLEKWFKEDTLFLQKECEELIKIIVTIIKNTKNNHWL